MPPKNSKKVEIESRRYQILDLKIAGASDRQIAAQIGVSHRTAGRDVHAILGQLAKEHLEAADDMRALVMARYERLLLTYWAQAIGASQGAKPDKEAASLCLRILGNIREVWGLDQGPGSSTSKPMHFRGELKTIHELVLEMAAEDDAQAPQKDVPMLEGNGRVIDNGGVS